MKPLSPVAVRKLLGIRNTVRPERQPFGALADAIDVIVDDTFTIERREGYSRSLALSGATDLYAPFSHEALLAVIGGQLIGYGPELTPAVLQSGLNQGVYAWAELGDRVFYGGASEAGTVVDGLTWQPLKIPAPEFWAEPMVGSLPQGRYQVTATYTHDASGVEGPAAPAKVVEVGVLKAIASGVTALPGYTANLYVSEADGAVPYLNGYLPLAIEQRDAQPFPDDVTALAAQSGVLYAAVYDPINDIGFVHWSQPFWFTCWKLATDYLSLPGKVLGMAGITQGLLILTSYSCWLWDGERIAHLADYGGVPGRPIARDSEGGVWFWTEAGLCTVNAGGFSNLTADHVSVAPGNRCTATVLERRGSKWFVVATDGGGRAANAYDTAPAGTCWAVNLRHAELTRFTRWDFDAFGHFNGETYGLKVDGLYALGGDTDALPAAMPIVARMTLQPTDFGDSTLKRCTGAYLTGCDTADLTVTPVCDGDTVGSYTGRRRIPLARGRKGQFWSFQISDGYGGPLRLTGLEILVEPTTRRV